MRKVFANLMKVVGEEDSKVVVLVGDISHFALQPFAESCPGRFYNVGILEPTIVSMAAGMSASGLFPVVHTIAPFLIERSFEQIKLDFCYHELGGSLVSVGSAFDYTGLGCSHHSYNDLALIKGLPNTEVIYPASDTEFEELFRTTYRNSKLTYFRLPTNKHSEKISTQQIKLGKGIRIKEGNRVTVVVTGPLLQVVLEQLPTIESKIGSVDLLYFPTLKPFDSDLVRNSAEKTRKILVIEDHSLTGGLAQDTVFSCLTVPNMKFEFICIPNEFQRGYGSIADHYKKIGFTGENVVNRLSELVK